MEHFDSEQVRKIWKRVQSGAGYNPNPMPLSRADTGLNLRELIAREMAEKMLLLQISARFSGKNAAILRQMAKQTQNCAVMLRGVHAMTDGDLLIVQKPKPTAAPTAILLRRCYGQSLQTLSEYEQRTSDPQFGSVFQTLAEQKKAHCRVLLALLGSLPSPKKN